MAVKLKTRIAPEVPTSSMADIAFLLIIFFMLTAVYSTNHGLEYGLPQKEDLSNVKPLESMHVRVLGIDNYTIDKKPATLPQIGGYIDSKLRQNPKKPVIIQTDPEVPYYATIEVLDLCKSLQVENISIPTNSEVALWGGFTGETEP